MLTRTFAVAFTVPFLRWIVRLELGRAGVPDHANLWHEAQAVCDRLQARGYGYVDKVVVRTALGFEFTSGTPEDIVEGHGLALVA
jgi:hypothetical protein